MVTDMYIHIFRGITEDDWRVFFSRTMDSKYPSIGSVSVSDEEWYEAYCKIVNTPSVWVGEVSWMGARFLEDREKYVPTAIWRIDEIIGGDLPVITDELIARVEDALRLPNKTRYRVADPEKVVKFLQKYKGERCFTATW